MSRLQRIQPTEQPLEPTNFLGGLHVDIPKCEKVDMQDLANAFLTFQRDTSIDFDNSLSPILSEQPDRTCPYNHLLSSVLGARKATFRVLKTCAPRCYNSFGGFNVPGLYALLVQDRISGLRSLEARWICVGMRGKILLNTFHGFQQAHLPFNTSLLSETVLRLCWISLSTNKIGTASEFPSREDGRATALPFW